MKVSTKFVSFVVAFLAFICVSFATTSVKADTYSTNKEVVVNTLLDNGYTYNQAITIASSMDISSTETLVGVDILPRTERSVAYTSSQILSKSDVRQIFNNINNVNLASSILGGIIGAKNPILGTVIGLGGFQNPNFKNAITQAYYQGKRVKIVYKSGASMSLNTVSYYFIN